MGYFFEVVNFACEHPKYSERFRAKMDCKAAARYAHAAKLTQRFFE